VFDRVWDWILDATGVQDWIRSRPAGEMDTVVDRQRRRVYGADPKTAVDFINYHRSRMRLARAGRLTSL
jgi:outer membrane biogenesis lipoprotein LolB